MKSFDCADPINKSSGTGQASHPIRPLSCLQSAVFLINSCSGLVSSTDLSLRSKSFTKTVAPSPEVTVPICLVSSPEFSKAPWYSLPTHLCRFTVRFLCSGSIGDVPGSMVSSTSVCGESPSAALRIQTIESSPGVPTTVAYHLKHWQPASGWPKRPRQASAATTSTAILTCDTSATLSRLA